MMETAFEEAKAVKDVGQVTGVPGAQGPGEHGTAAGATAFRTHLRKRSDISGTTIGDQEKCRRRRSG